MNAECSSSSAALIEIPREVRPEGITHQDLGLFSTVFSRPIDSCSEPLQRLLVELDLTSTDPTYAQVVDITQVQKNGSRSRREGGCPKAPTACTFSPRRKSAMSRRRPTKNWAVTSILIAPTTATSRSASVGKALATMSPR